MIGTQNRARREYLFITYNSDSSPNPPKIAEQKKSNHSLTHNFCRGAYVMLFLGVKVHSLKLNSFDVRIKVSFTFRFILLSLFTKLYIFLSIDNFSMFYD